MPASDKDSLLDQILARPLCALSSTRRQHWPQKLEQNVNAVSNSSKLHP